MSSQTPGLRLFLAPDVHLDPAETGRVHVFRSGMPVLTLTGTSREEVEALEHLRGTGAEPDALARPVLERGSTTELARWYQRLLALERARVVRYGVFDHDRLVAVGRPLVSDFHPTFVSVRARSVTLSRIAVLQTCEGVLGLESPRSPLHVSLMDPSAALLIHRIAVPVAPADVASDVPISSEAVASMLSLFYAAGLLESPEEGAEATELDPWEREDLRFHAHSRLGHHDRPLGGVFPGSSATPPPPVLKPQRERHFIVLEPPSLCEIEARDMTLTAAMEARTSVREYGPRAMELTQLSEFLFRTARIRSTRTVASGHDTPADYEVSSRPYPSGGACYPLEWYLGIRSCGGIEPGLYHYDPEGHRLGEVTTDRTRLTRLARSYGWPTYEDAPPVLVILTARVGRTSWKYASVAYSLILKEVGVVMQSMYLVATAMGLAPCALGSGDDRAFARVAGVDPIAEVTVGEFMLGSGPDVRPMKD